MHFLDILKDYEGALAFVGALLALVALAFAFIQFKDAKFHTSNLKLLVNDLINIKTEMSENLIQLLDDLKIVKCELSTTYLTEFPYYLPDINNLINSAERELIIMCDFPAYSYISDFQGWITYHSLINTKKAAGIDVTMICLSKEQRIERVKEQFLDIDDGSSAEAWAKCLSNEKFQKKINPFIHLHDKGLFRKGHKIYTPAELPLSRFIELVEIANGNVIDSEFLGLDIYEIKSQLSLFCWIADNTRAVFAIPRSGVNNNELGFKTSDETLISALKSLVKSYKHNSSAVSRQE
jgi:hypothetical protein